jgi:hypothetical protein
MVSSQHSPSIWEPPIADCISPMGTGAAPCKKRLLSQRFLCLSRACLGKTIILTCKNGSKRGVFRTGSGRPEHQAAIMSLLQPARWSCGECCPAHGAQSKTLPRVEPAEVEMNHRPPPSDPQSSFELVLSSLRWTTSMHCQDRLAQDNTQGSLK